jgi:hypothetical protein
MTKLRAATAALVLSGAVTSATDAKAVNLDELSKYLAFIEGFQHIFEYCQAETTLPQPQVTYARNHIGERRALIFADLHEIQRDKITADMPTKKAQMLKGVMEHVKKDQPGVPLKELCKQGFFAGVMESEQKSEANEIAAIRKAKN